MKIKLKYYLQKLFGLFLNSPIILNDKTVGYSLIKSERSDCKIDEKTNVIPPYYLHKVTLGKYSYIAKNSNITNTRIGSFCAIGPNFCCGLGTHPVHGISTAPMFYSTAKQNGFTLCTENKIEESVPTTIGHDVFIGANVTILDGAKIGNGAVVGAGGVVTGDIPPYAIATGVPAKVKKYRFEKDIIEILLEKKWWYLQWEELKIIEKNFFDVHRLINFLDKK
jgi:virginiamycin A acetyltransferase